MSWNHRSTLGDWSGYTPEWQVLQSLPPLKLAVDINTAKRLTVEDVLLYIGRDVYVFFKGCFVLEWKDLPMLIQWHAACSPAHVLRAHNALFSSKQLSKGACGSSSAESGSRAVFVQELFFPWLNPNGEIQQIICVAKHASLHPLRCETHSFSRLLLSLCLLFLRALCCFVTLSITSCCRSHIRAFLHSVKAY